MKSLFYIILILLSLLAIDCNKKTPDQSLEQLKKTACSSDIKAFFKNINIDKLRINYLKQLKEKVKIEDELHTNDLFKTYLHILTDEVRRGEESKFCNFTVLTKERELDSVYYKLVDRQKSEFYIRFLKFGKVWLVSEISE